MFDANELEYLMCGITQIDVKDWEEYTVYKGGYNKNHHVVVWFWKVCYIRIIIKKNAEETNGCYVKLQIISLSLQRSTHSTFDYIPSGHPVKLNITKKTPKLNIPGY